MIQAFGLAHSLSHPEGEEDERDEAREDSAVQGELDDAHQLIGWCDLGGVIWEVDNGDRVPRGGVEAIGALANGTGVALACSVGELYREDILRSRFPTRDGLLADDDSLCCDAVS